MATSTARSVSAPAASSDQVADLLEATPVSSYQLTADDWAVGQSLAAVNLRAETGATILALKRGGTTLAPPAVEWLFAAGDVLYVVGDQASVRQARARLATGEARATDRPPQDTESV
jgi:K+/H+ antiporter YhaU regulatory subunit KhtT